MRALIQKVSYSRVYIEKELKSEIGKGLLVLLGIENEDTEEDIRWLSNKVSQLRIFEDNKGIMNISVSDIDGEVMIISQFTLHGKTKKGTRPSYSKAAKPDIAIPLYEKFIVQMEQDLDKKVKTGEFGAYMKIELENDGPVTIMIDSKNKNL
ncbi:MAG: D-aminoacyl-tRNA deacylase [Bacteroidales bacterium]